MKKLLKRLGAVTLAVMTVAMAFAGSSMAAFGGFGADVSVSSGNSFGFGSTVTSGSGFGSSAGSSSSGSSAAAQESAKTYGEIVNVKNNVNFRSSTSNKASKVDGCTVLKKGAAVEILGSEGDWYKLSYNGYVGYVKKDYVKVTAAGSSSSADASSDSSVSYGKIVNVSSNVNFRSSASNKASKVDGCPVLLKDAVVEILGVSGSWYKLSYNGYTGYVKQTYVEKIAAPAADSSASAGSGSASSGSTGSSSSGFSGFGSSGSSSSSGFGSSGSSSSFGSSSSSGFGFGSSSSSGSSGSTTGSSGSSSFAGTTSSVSSKAVLTSADQTKIAAMSSNYAAALKKNSDVKGYIYVPGTNVDYPILYSSSFYYNDHNINRQKETRGCIYSYSSAMPSCGFLTISGHNSRSSGTMFHELHDWQNALKKNKNGNRIAFIQFAGTNYTQWEVFAMYETKNTSAAGEQMRINILQHTVNTTGDAKQAWIDYQINKSEVNFGTTANASDQIIVLMTCGDNYQSVSNARLYFFLKGVA